MIYGTSLKLFHKYMTHACHNMLAVNATVLTRFCVEEFKTIIDHEK